MTITIICIIYIAVMFIVYFLLEYLDPHYCRFGCTEASDHVWCSVLWPLVLVIDIVVAPFFFLSRWARKLRKIKTIDGYDIVK